MNHIIEELGIPKKYINSTLKEDKFVVNVHRTWIKNLLKQSKLTEFIEKPSSIDASSETNHVGQSWMKIYIRLFKKGESKVLPLPRIRNTKKCNIPLLFPQFLQYISQTNYKNLWKEAYKKYSNNGDHIKDVPIALADYNDVLREIISQTYGCAIINVCDASNSLEASKSFDAHLNIYPAACAIETLHAIFLIHLPHVGHNLNDCVTFSPSILEKCQTKPLFIIYQLLQLLNSLHNLHITMGDINLNDIYLTDDLWLYVFPQLLSNVHLQDVPKIDIKQSLNGYDCRVKGHKYDTALKCQICGMKTYDRVQVGKNDTLEKLCDLWIHGQISNFTYITALNRFSGRKYGDPNCHHVFPWVTDFSSRCGKTWRNLNKSKYRLNKGDRQLDLTYDDSESHQIPHHVSDVLSAITYYVYVARRTSKATLCKYVRSTWVPCEYPSSIQRLQQWTPDECIPEFFTDPAVFKSIHDDMDDLEVPAWSSGPEDFVEKHRELLESSRVSERLHYWIDLTFGYKLSGNAAIKSKNVCLHLVDEHTNLTSSGIVQLFKYPHPVKIVRSPYFSKSPPQTFVRKHRDRDDSASAATAADTSRSEDDDPIIDLDATNAASSAGRSPLTLSRFLSRSRSSLNEEREQKPSRSPSSQRSISLGPKSPSFTSHIPNKCGNDNLVPLLKDYNPSQALTNLENRHTFYTRTFHKQYEKTVRHGTSDMSDTWAVNDECDLQYDDDIIRNSFTNKIFAENYERRPVHLRATKSHTFPTDRATIDVLQWRVKSRPTERSSQVVCNYSEIIASRKIKELQVLGCLVVEIFMSKHTRSLGNNTIDMPFKHRLQSCVTVLKSCKSEVPSCIRYLATLLLQPDEYDGVKFDYPTVSDIGLPPPSAHLLLEPFLRSVVPFPSAFLHLYTLIANLKDFENTTTELNTLFYFECNGQRCTEFEALEKTRIACAQNVAECKVKSCVKYLENLIDHVRPERDAEIVNLLVPHVKNLLEDVQTAVSAAWYLFDPVSKLLGPQRSCDVFLEPMLKLYEADLNECNVPYLNKIAKLYHHSFHLRLIVRFGLKCFLEHFVTPLVEAIGGYRDHDVTDFTLHTHTEKVVVRKTSNLKSIGDETNDDYYSPDDSSSSERNSLPSKRRVPEKAEAVTAEPEVFDFEGEEVAPLESLIEHLELNDEITFKRSPTSEEAIEELELNVTEETEETGKAPLMSPTIPIPNKNKDLVQIYCDVGSKSSDYDVQMDKKSEDVDRTKTDQQPLTSGSKMNRYDAKISEISAESLNWLSHRLGPVLTAKYLSRNLLKMLTLCYVGKDNLSPLSPDGDAFTSDLNLLSCSNIVGDKNAANVLECLTNIAALYGEQFILLQYIPHVTELIALCKRRLSPNLEGSLISCLSLLKYIIPCLSDATLVAQLDDILKTVVHPSVRLLGSTKFAFPNGYHARRALAVKYLDALYMLSLRMGADMSRTHLAVPALQRFFLIFEKIDESVHRPNDTDDKLVKCFEESQYIEVKSDGSTSEWIVSGKPLQITHVRLKDTETAYSLSPTPPQELTMKDDTVTNQALDELRSVFTPELAHTGYLPFLKQMGQSALQISLKNHETILKLCQDHEQEMRVKNPNFSSYLKIDNYNYGDGYQSSTTSSLGSNIALIGNRIDVQEEPDECKVNIPSLISEKMENNSRHLRGNWLAYWEHEIGRSEMDNRFNFKQIKLQTFNGHTHSIKALHVLDNENSFISGSRDKTVKLWSLRSQGDGSSISACQWTYTEHKKSILALTFIESIRLVASCDSIIRIWDPFMMRDIKNMESSKHAPVNVLKTMPAPSAMLFAATTEGTVKVIDARLFAYVHELKVNQNQTCLIRCLAVSNSGHWVAAGQSSGYITVLDTRTGLVKSNWRAHESEVLQLVAYGEHNLISSSLDQTISVWNVQDGRFLHHMNLYLPRGASEPVHCLNLYNNELISGTTANRIGVHTSVDLDASFYSIKLRQDAFKGLLTSMTILPLNRLLLLGADSGSISLLC